MANVNFKPQVECGIKSSGFVRVVKHLDDKQRLISYDVVDASKDPMYLSNLNREIEQNMLEIKHEEELKEQVLKEQIEHEKYLKDYSLNNLLNAFNVAMIKGFIPSTNKAQIVQEVCNIACTEDQEERTKLTYDLINNTEYDLGYFKVIFGNLMED